MSQQGIQTAYNKANKISYKYLNYEEKRLVKINEKLEKISNFLNYLWGIAPRKQNGSVNWFIFEKENKMDYQYLLDNLKQEQRLIKSKATLIEKYDLNEEKIINLFRGTQFSLSESYF